MSKEGRIMDVHHCNLEDLEVTQQNLYLFLPAKVANVAAIIAEQDPALCLKPCSASMLRLFIRNQNRKTASSGILAL